MRSFIAIVFGFLFGNCIAQDQYGFWDKKTVKVGEQAQLQIVVKNPPSNFQYKPHSGTVSCAIQHKNETLWKPGGEMEIRSFEDTIFTKKGIRYWNGTYQMIAWDSASYRLDPFFLQLDDSVISIQAPELNVGFEKKKVKDGIEEIAINPVSDWWLLFKKYWWAVALVLLAIVGLIFWNKRKKFKKESQLSLRERTLLALNGLRKKEDWLHGRIKQHYSAFSSMLKMYLGARFDLHLMERTTQETVLLLKVKNLDNELIRRIEQLLREADMVKFAKTEPSDLQVRASLLRFEELIQELSPLEVSHE